MTVHRYVCRVVNGNDDEDAGCLWAIKSLRGVSVFDLKSCFGLREEEKERKKRMKRWRNIMSDKA